MTMFKIYLITILDNILTGAILATALCGLATIITSIMVFAEYSDGDREEAQKILKPGKLFIITVVAFFISIFTPSTKQAAFIWIAPQLVENGEIKQTVKNIPELTALATEYIKKTLKDKIND